MEEIYKRAKNNEIIKKLSLFLSDTSIVYYKTHAFHWNIEGQNFYSLHLMFEKFYTNLWESLDDIAERIRSLGDKAPPCFTELLQHFSISEMDRTPPAEVMLQTLLDDYVLLAQSANELAIFATAQNDLVTADLMVKRAAFLEKAAWMLRSTIVNCTY
jgi:starvation-inducible DNA-binding protein